jgi:hypothetical protein
MSKPSAKKSVNSDANPSAGEDAAAEDEAI